MRDQARTRPYVYRQEVTRSLHLPMGLEQGLTLCSPAPLDAIAFQDIGNRAATNLVTEIGQRSLNAGIAPARSVLRHAHDQLRDDLCTAGDGASWSCPFDRRTGPSELHLC